MRNLSLREDDRRPEMTIGPQAEFEIGGNSPLQALDKGSICALLPIGRTRTTTVRLAGAAISEKFHKLRDFYNTFTGPTMPLPPLLAILIRKKPSA